MQDGGPHTPAQGWSWVGRLRPGSGDLQRGLQHLHEEGVDGCVPDELEEEQVLQALQADGAQGWEAEQQLGKPAGKPKGRQEPGSAAPGSCRHRGARQLSNLGEDRGPGRATEAAGRASVLGSISSALPGGLCCAHTTLPAPGPQATSVTNARYRSASSCYQHARSASRAVPPFQSGAGGDPPEGPWSGWEMTHTRAHALTHSHMCACDRTPPRRTHTPMHVPDSHHTHTHVHNHMYTPTSSHGCEYVQRKPPIVTYAHTYTHLPPTSHLYTRAHHHTYILAYSHTCSHASHVYTCTHMPPPLPHLGAQTFTLTHPDIHTHAYAYTPIHTHTFAFTLNTLLRVYTHTRAFPHSSALLCRQGPWL